MGKKLPTNSVKSATNRRPVRGVSYLFIEEEEGTGVEKLAILLDLPNADLASIKPVLSTTGTRESAILVDIPQQTTISDGGIPQTVTIGKHEYNVTIVAQIRAIRSIKK